MVPIWWLEGSLGFQSSPATLFEAGFLLFAAALYTTYCPWVSGDFVSTFYLAIRVWGLQNGIYMRSGGLNFLMMFRTLRDDWFFVYLFRITSSSLNTSNPFCQNSFVERSPQIQLIQLGYDSVS